MSGPKVDKAEIRKQEKDRLLRERLRRQQLAEEMEAQLEQFREAVRELAQVDTLEAPSQELLEQVEEMLREQLTAVREANETFDVTLARQNLQKLLQPHREQLQNLQRRAAGIREREQSEELTRQAQEQLSGGKRRTIAFLQQKNQGPSAQEQRSQLEQQLQELMNRPNLNTVHKSTLLNFRRQLEDPMTGIETALESFRQVQSVILADVRNLEELYRQYRMECFDGEALPLSAFHSADEIRQATDRAREQASKNMEKEYIKRQIDQVMEKYGYNVIESQQLQQLNATGQTFYEVDEDTAINVFVSNNSQVSMRVVGIGVSDTISAREDDMLYEQQCAFCAMHPRITAELALRGVLLTTKEHKAPDRKFNKKIVAGDRTDRTRKRKMQAAQQRVLYKG